MPCQHWADIFVFFLFMPKLSQNQGLPARKNQKVHQLCKGERKLNKNRAAEIND